MYILLLLICAASLSFTANLNDFHHEINQNIQRFHQQLPLNPISSDYSYLVDNSKTLPVDLLMSIADYLDRPSLLSFSSTCKLFHHTTSLLISKQLTSLNSFYLFPEDRFNKALYFVLKTNLFFKPAAIPTERIKMLVHSFARYKALLPHLPDAIYNRLVIFLVAINAPSLNTFELFNFLQDLLDTLSPSNQHSFHRIFLFRALIDHRDLAVNCFFNPEFLQNFTIENFNRILFNSLDLTTAQKLLKGLSPSVYNQQSDKSFDSIMNRLETMHIFHPSIDSFLTIISVTFERFRLNPSPLLFKLISAFAAPESPAKLALVWYTYTKYFNEYFNVYKQHNYTWWSLFYSVLSDFIRIYPQHTQQILALTAAESFEELQLKFLSEMAVNKAEALESSAFQGHLPTISFLLAHFQYSPLEISAAILKAASTEFIDTLTLLLSSVVPENETIFKATRFAVNLNNVGSFNLLLNYARDNAIPIEQDHLNRYFLCACRSHFLEISSFLLNTFPFPPHILKTALSNAASMPDSEIFCFLINQTVHQFTPEDYNELLCKRIANESEYEDTLIDLLLHYRLFSHEGVLKAFNLALVNKNHRAITCLLNYFIIPSSEADILLLNCIQLGPDYILTCQFLFEVNLQFTRQGLIDAYIAATILGDQYICSIIRYRMKCINFLK